MSRFGDLLGGKTPAPAPAAPAQPTPVAVPSEPAEAIAPDPIVVEEVVEESEEESEEESVSESDLSLYDMSKRELEDYARTVGLELDRRHSKTALIQELSNYLGS